MTQTFSFSNRSRWASGMNPLTEALAKLRAQKIEVLDLTASNPTHCAFDYLKPELLDPLKDPGNLRYEPDARGLLKSREIICEYYARKGIRIAPEQIFLTASTSEAYSFVFRLLLNPGDGILAPRPSYPLLDYLAEINDATVTRYSLLAANHWGIDFERFPQPKSGQTKAILCVNPNNPTGNYVTQNELSRLNQIVCSSSLALISDEVFLDFDLMSSSGLTGGSTALDSRLRGNDKLIRFAANDEVLTFTLSGISKLLGLPQMKLAWIVVTGPAANRKEAISRLEIIADTFLSVSTPVQRALPFWFSRLPEIQKEILNRIQVNGSALLKTFRDCSGFKAHSPQGGWTALLEYHGGESDENLALKLLNEKRVLLHPGYLFDFEAENFLVLSLLVPPPVFERGLQKILEF